jgi:hypothetical protein
LLVDAGMTPLEAIRTATFNAAQVMHATQEWGSLQAGRQASVVIVAGNPAERISDTRKIETVILSTAGFWTAIACGLMRSGTRDSAPYLEIFRPPYNSSDCPFRSCFLPSNRVV